MKKERIFYLDFIRALAVILILLTHYNALFLYMEPQQLDKVVITYRVCNLYIGDFGVSLFFIISGAALMYVYEQKLNLINFYKKRFLAIYPMFWVGYSIAFCFQKIVNHVSYAGLPKKTFLLTIVGFDGYFNTIMPTFWLVGEWFLGCIILVYAIFPLLRWAICKYPGVACAVVILIYLLALVCYETPFPKAVLLAVRLPEVCFGMLYMKCFKKTDFRVALVAMAGLVLNTLIAPAFDSNIQTTYVGIMAFLVLSYIAKFIEFNWVKAVCGFLSKYSYAIFLVHHFVIYRVAERVDFSLITLWGSYIVFMMCVAIIIPVSLVLFHVNEGVQKLANIIRNRFFVKEEG